jgi:ATP/maltotriose-dependent transcriptional regulator MalT
MPHSGGGFLRKNSISCVSDANEKIIEQSQSCKELCGVKLGEECTTGCKYYLKLKTEEKGSILLKNKFVQNSQYDILRYYQDTKQIVFLIPREKEETVIDDFMTLTIKEQEVAQLIVKGYSNQEILMELNILKSTLKTHINRIYQKLDTNFQKFRKLIAQ